MSIWLLIAGIALAQTEPVAPEVPMSEPVADVVLAPEVSVSQWIAQGPVADAADAVAVYEVWATWCGPCRETFPKLTTLQSAYGERIRVMAVTDDRDDKVRKYYHDNRENMRFAIGVTDSETIQSLMLGGFGGRGIPSVYVVRDGQMVWSGQPDGLEAALLEHVGPSTGS